MKTQAREKEWLNTNNNNNKITRTTSLPGLVYGTLGFSDVFGLV